MSSQKSSGLSERVASWSGGLWALIYGSLGAGIGILIGILTVAPDEGLVIISKNEIVFAYAVLGFLGGIVVFALLLVLTKLWRSVAGRSSHTPDP